MWEINIENIGGIRSGEAEIKEGVNVIQASNFKGKTSLLKAIQTAMGTTGFGKDEQHPLTQGASTGKVILKAEDETYEVTLERDDGGVITRTGNPYIEDNIDSTCARLFAFLGENNPIRSAIRENDGEKLKENLQKPIKLENIEEKVDKKRKERDKLEAKIKDAETAAEKLPKVQEEVTKLEGEIEDLEKQEKELKQEVDENSDHAQLQSELSSKQGTLESTQSRIGRLESRLDSSKERLKEKENELEDLEVPGEVTEDVDLNDLEEEIGALESQINLLQDLHRSNKNFLESNHLELVSTVDRQIDEDEFNCWLCGDKTSQSEVEENLSEIATKIQSLKDEKGEIEEQISETKRKQKEARKKREERDNLKEEIQNINLNIEETEQDIKQAESKKEKLQEEIDELEEEYEEVEENLDKELSETQRKLGTKETDLERKRGELEDLEEEAKRKEELKAERSEISNEIESLLERRSKKINQLKSEFDAALDDIIDKFAPGFDGGYLSVIGDEENVDGFRISLAGDGRALEIGTTPDSSNTSVDDPTTHLSEGELELVGIATAMAGYRTFDVDQKSPAILIDGIGQLAAEHIHNLTEYLEGQSDTLITTAYPEAGDFNGEILDPHEWEVISHEEQAAA